METSGKKRVSETMYGGLRVHVSGIEHGRIRGVVEKLMVVEHIRKRR